MISTLKSIFSGAFSTVSTIVLIPLVLVVIGLMCIVAVTIFTCVMGVLVM